MSEQTVAPPEDPVWVGTLAVLLVLSVVALVLVGAMFARAAYRDVIAPWWFTRQCMNDGYDPVTRFTLGRAVIEAPPSVTGGVTACVDGDRVVRTLR